MELRSVFFLTDLRRATRQSLRTWAGFLAVQGLVLTLPLLTAELIGTYAPPDASKKLFLWLSVTVVLMIGHQMLVWFAGSRLGGMALIQERMRGTLEALQLVSLPPGRLLLQKLLFPLAAYVLVWAAAWPVYVIFWLRNLLPFPLLAALYLLAGCQGLAQFGVTLLDLPNPRLKITAPLPHRITRIRYLLYPLIMCVLYVETMSYLFTSMLQMLGFLPHVALLLPGWRLWCAVAAYSLACGGVAMTALAPSSRWVPVLARWSPWIACAVIYAMLLLLGYGFFRSSVPWTVVVGPPAVLFGIALLVRWVERGMAGLPSSPPASAQKEEHAEVRWLARRWDSAVLVRDLRSFLRRLGLTTSGLMSLGALALVALALGGLSLLPSMRLSLDGVLPTQGSPGLLFIVRGAAVMLILFPLIVACIVGGAGERARVLWTREQQEDRFLQVALTRLQPREVVAGRWAAVMVEMLPALIAATLLGAVFYLLAGRALHLDPPALVLLLAQAVSAGLLTAATQGSKVSGKQTGVALSVRLATFPNAALFITLAVDCFMGRSRLHPWLILALLVCAWINGRSIRRLFRDTVRTVERMWQPADAR